jgi:3',5'-cyclic AMP phosphodiesterase CpdA
MARTRGTEQLAWLDAQLARRRLTLLFLHHGIVPPTDGAPVDPASGGALALLAALEAHPGVVRAVFMGHRHRFRRTAWNGTTFYEVDALKQGADPGWLIVECDGRDGTVRIRNEAEVPCPQDPE